ncbi:helix-turn-helix transcriptional regulator [Enterococcus sp. BWM-S5]|uniref:Helix-turn-helix transcriptional regulator n=1 Tax=Enterococcus larvae TaxID=2794352 RepID=A0ABS4CDP9_9ENTE|nr:helix-turn-helix transcriptional regulator [Enterococcus larvae]MBP1044655.1 helix-turn-helix transcriptional regulator [Enterococcus larvae]
MKMNLGSVIAEKRKEKKITQQELAEFVGVSKAAVSKWETGLTYPDITLLPLLAAYFDMTIDSLLNYEPQLTTKEIQHIYTSLKGSFETKSPEDVLTSIRSFVHRYYSCHPFVLQMGLLVINHIDRLPGATMEDKVQQYMKEAGEWFVHVRTESKDPECIIHAAKLEAYTLLTLQEADRVLEILGETLPTSFPVESLIAGAFQIKGENDRAIATLQSALFQYIGVIMSLFTNYLQLLTDEPEKFKETVKRGEQLAEIFDLQQLHPILLLNFQLSAASGFAQMKDDQGVVVLEKFTDVLSRTSFPTGFHGDAYFDQVDQWFDSLETGSQTPRDSEMVKTDMIDFVLTNPLFLALSDQKDIQKIVLRLEQLKKRDLI